MKATLLDYMGADLTVVNAARVSFGKRSETLTDKDIKLIHYLASHGHWTPFAHPQLAFHMEAPFFVAKQLAKHQVGGVWNEVSRRYVDEEPKFYWPSWRRRAAEKKQGSGSELPDQRPLDDLYWDFLNHCEEIYERFLVAGACPEQARAVLPLATYTEWHWTGSLAFFARVCKQRLDTHTQQETRELVQQISDQIEPLFPHSWSALNANSGN